LATAPISGTFICWSPETLAMYAPQPILKDPVQASIPKLRGGDLGAVYYGQRRKGDFYDVARVNQERVLFGLFDIAGDLKQTRPIMLALQESFRSTGVELLSTTGSNENEAMLELWIQMNRAVMKSAGGVHSCPAFVGCFNEELRTLAYVNAGHTPGLVRDHAEPTELGATALPLGLFSHSVPDSSVVALGPGHCLLLVSRGIVEARRKGEEFGIERAKQYLQDVAFESAHETCVGLLGRIRQFMGTAPTHNDVTALCLLRSV
jgi:sigma-B regulation protein RsbU (phosphoserine phosphatase)